MLRRVLGSKKIKMQYATGRTREATRNVPTPREDRQCFCIDDKDVLTLAEYAIKVEKHYSAKAGYDKPMDMEWAKDGIDGELYMVQARPETVESQISGTTLQVFHLKQDGEVLTAGNAVGTRIAVGNARLIKDVSLLHEFQAGEVLVADTTTPDWEPVMKKAAAIVTNRGGRTCHAAIIARELGIPAIVGCNDATHAIPNGEPVTADCSQGNRGRIFAGLLDFEIESIDLSNLSKPDTDIMINLGNPDLAFKTSFLPNDGVGLARMEFIINESIKAHPMALLQPERVRDPEQRKQIETLCRGYASPTDFFVKHLSEGVGTIAAAFWPKPVVVRMSDFKSNEYASLLGGQFFEPNEANPMLGFRGCRLGVLYPEITEIH